MASCTGANIIHSWHQKPPVGLSFICDCLHHRVSSFAICVCAEAPKVIEINKISFDVFRASEDN